MNDFHEFGEVDVEPTVTVSRSYLADLVKELQADYEGDYVDPASFKSEALRTLWYLANEE